MEDLIINSAFVGSQAGADKGSSSGEGTTETGSEDFLGILKNLMYGKNSQKNVPDEVGGLESEGVKGLSMAPADSGLADVMKGGASKGGGPAESENGDAKTTGQEKATGIEICYDQIAFADSQAILAATAPTPDVTGDQGTGQAQGTGIGALDSAALQAALDREEALKYLAMLADSQAILAATAPTPDVTGDQGTGQAQGTGIGALDSAALQAALDQVKTASYLEQDAQPESLTMNGSDSATLSGQSPLNSVMALLADRMSSGEEPKTEIEVINGQNKVPLSQEDLIKQSIEKNTEAARALEGQGGQTDNGNGTTSDGAGKDKDKGNAALHSQTGSQKVTDSTFVYDIEAKETATGGSVQTSDVFMRNAVKKYGLFAEDRDATDDKADAKSVDGPLTNRGLEVSQGDSSRTNVFQTKEDAKVFEKGPFSSFMTDRVEKVVEQYAARNSSADTVVRLKLDDKETLTVGLKHEGQNVVVEVKASNEGLANLLQSHKEDMTRHLEDKNIFARMYVEADGENGFERRNQRQNKQEDGRKEGETSFTAVLEAIA